MTLTSRVTSLRANSRTRSLAFTSLFVFAAAAAAACSGNSHSESGNSPHGTAAEAGQAGESALGSGGSISVAGSGAKASTGGTDAGAGAADGVTGGSTGSSASAGMDGSGLNSGSASAPAFGATQCNDGIDNDGDGLIDGLDPECSGPWDNDEGSFATGIPGDNKDPKWQDCFFDGNSGAGDDGCRYPTSCLTGDTPQDDPACAITQSCIDYCAALTPNGCDCFGCCTVELADGSSVDIEEASTCSLSNIDDTKACPRCSKSAACGNTCGECELCPGKTAADLPASCTPPDTGSGGAGGSDGTGGSDATGGTSGSSGSTSTGGSDATGGTGGTDTPPPPPAYTCDGGEQVCGPGLDPCAEGYYCTLGCCMVVVR